MINPIGRHIKLPSQLSCRDDAAGHPKWPGPLPPLTMQLPASAHFRRLPPPQPCPRHGRG
jgi:hypothetical protein